MITLNDLDIYEIDNSIQQWGRVYSDGRKLYVVPFPDENPEDVTACPMEVLVMNLTLPNGSGS